MSGVAFLERIEQDTAAAVVFHPRGGLDGVVVVRWFVLIN